MRHDTISSLAVPYQPYEIGVPTLLFVGIISISRLKKYQSKTHEIKVFIVYMIFFPISSSVQSKQSPPLNTLRCNRT